MAASPSTAAALVVAAAGTVWAAIGAMYGLACCLSRNANRLVISLGSNGEQGRAAHLVKGGLYRRKRLQLPVRTSYSAGSLQYHTQSWISVCTAKHHMAQLAHCWLAAHCRNLRVECQEEGRVHVLRLCVDPTLRYES